MYRLDFARIADMRDRSCISFLEVIFPSYQVVQGIIILIYWIRLAGLSSISSRRQTWVAILFIILHVIRTAAKSLPPRFASTRSQSLNCSSPHHVELGGQMLEPQSRARHRIVRGTSRPLHHLRQVEAGEARIEVWDPKTGQYGSTLCNPSQFYTQVENSD